MKNPYTFTPFTGKHCMCGKVLIIPRMDITLPFPAAKRRHPYFSLVGFQGKYKPSCHQIQYFFVMTMVSVKAGTLP